jgi:hypothetical protein
MFITLTQNLNPDLYRTVFLLNTVVMISLLILLDLRSHVPQIQKHKDANIIYPIISIFIVLVLYAAGQQFVNLSR